MASVVWQRLAFASAVLDEIGVGAHHDVEWELLGQRPAQPFLAGCRFDEASHRPACFGHDIRERRVADIEIPQRGASKGARRTLAMGGEPGDQLTRLRPLEHRRVALLVDDVDRPEEADEQRPVRDDRFAVRGVTRIVVAIVEHVEPGRGVLDELGDGGQLVAIEAEGDDVDPHRFEPPGRPPLDQRVTRRVEGSGDHHREPGHPTRRERVGNLAHVVRTPRAGSPVPTPRRRPSANATRTSTPSPGPCSREVTWRGRTRRRTSHTRRGGDDRRTSPDPARHRPAGRLPRERTCRAWRRSR